MDLVSSRAWETLVSSTNTSKVEGKTDEELKDQKTENVVLVWVLLGSNQLQRDTEEGHGERELWRGSGDLKDWQWLPWLRTEEFLPSETRWAITGWKRGCLGLAP